MNLQDFFVCEIGIERNGKCRPVRFVAVGETRLIQIPVDRSKDRLATVNPLLLQPCNQPRQTVRITSEMWESDGKSIVPMRPAWGYARTDGSLGRQNITIG